MLTLLLGSVTNKFIYDILSQSVPQQQHFTVSRAISRWKIHLKPPKLSTAKDGLIIWLKSTIKSIYNWRMWHYGGACWRSIGVSTVPSDPLVEDQASTADPKQSRISFFLYLRCLFTPFCSHWPEPSVRQMRRRRGIKKWNGGERERRRQRKIQLLLRAKTACSAHMQTCCSSGELSHSGTCSYTRAQMPVPRLCV